MKPLLLSYDKKIQAHFPNGNEVLICLFPFYKQVFAEHYNWKNDLKITYPLIRTVSWKEIGQKIGFHSMNRLAVGILELKEPLKAELEEYCEAEKIDFPDYAADNIPEVILIPMIRFFLAIGVEKIYTREVSRFHDSENKIVSFENKNEFEIFSEIEEVKSFSTDNNIVVLLPDYDCPYAIISANKEICADITASSNLEYFRTNENTSFDWWNQDENIWEQVKFS